MSPRYPESGFTLVELLVALSILGAIMVALGTALFVGLRTTEDNTTILDQSNAEQVLANYLAKDVQAACKSPTPSGGPTCNRVPNPSVTAVSACGSTAQLAMDTLSNATAAAADTTVAYVLQSSSLTRVTCALGASSAASTHSIASNVTTLTASNPVSGACAGEFAVAVSTAGSAKGAGTNPYSFTICAHRRAG